MAENTYTASIRNYRRTYSAPQYVAPCSNSRVHSDMLAFYTIATRAEKPHRETTVSIAFRPLMDPWPGALNGVSRYPDRGGGHVYRFEPAPDNANALRSAPKLPANICEKKLTYFGGIIIDYAKPSELKALSSGAQG
jgi:hypothetical protein